MSRIGRGSLKPSFVTGINWSHDLARGLENCIIFEDGLFPTDLVTRSKYTVSGTPTLTVNMRGKGARFPGSGDLITVLNNKASTANAPISLFCIARAEDTTAVNRKRAIRFFDGTNGTIADIEFGDGASAKFFAGLQYSVPNFEIATGSSFNANQDYSVGMTWISGDNVRLYVDGRLDGVSPSTRTTALSGNNFTVGNSAGAGLNLRGTLYCAYRWSRFLTHSEMRELHLHPYAFLQTPKRRTIAPQAVVATGVKFRRTLSDYGTRTGSRQMVA